MLTANIQSGMRQRAEAIGVNFYGKPVNDVVAQLFADFGAARPDSTQSPQHRVHPTGKPGLVIERAGNSAQSGDRRAGRPHSTHAAAETISHSQRSVLPAPALEPDLPIDKHCINPAYFMTIITP